MMSLRSKKKRRDLSNLIRNRSNSVSLISLANLTPASSPDTWQLLVYSPTDVCLNQFEI